MQGTDALFSWGLERPEDLLALEPRLRFLREWRTQDVPEYRLIPAKVKLRIRLAEQFKPLRVMNRPLHYSF